MQLPIEDSKGKFELFISGKPLQKHLADGSLFVLDSKGEQYRVVSKDVTIRLNNWNKIKSSILEKCNNKWCCFWHCNNYACDGRGSGLGKKEKILLTNRST